MTVHQSVSLVLPTTIFQPIIDPHDDKGEKQDSTASLTSCLRYVGSLNYVQLFVLDIMTLNIKQNKGVDLICVCDVAGLMTILEFILKHRYDPFTCVLLNQTFYTGAKPNAFVSMMLLSLMLL